MHARMESNTHPTKVTPYDKMYLSPSPSTDFDQKTRVSLLFGIVSNFLLLSIFPNHPWQRMEYIAVLCFSSQYVIQESNLLKYISIHPIQRKMIA